MHLDFELEGSNKLYRSEPLWVDNTRLSPEEQPETEPAESGPQRGRKFYVALACYAAIALLAGLTLNGNFRLVVWVVLGYLAVRTYLHTLRKP